MSITRDSTHKRRATGGKRKAYRNKRKFEMGRQPAMTRLGPKRIHLVRCRFGIIKHRALRLETGNFAWPTQSIAIRARILNVVYNASNNELVRTNTLVRSAIVQVDAVPFRQWFLKHYGIEITRRSEQPTEAKKPEAKKPEQPTEAKKPEEKKPEAKKPEEKKPEEKKPEEAKKADEKKPEEKKKKEKKEGPSKTMLAKFARRQKLYKMDSSLEDEFGSGRLLARITSRPGQVGRADGYVLEGKELEFYQRKLEKKKKAK